MSSIGPYTNSGFLPKELPDQLFNNGFLHTNESPLNEQPNQDSSDKHSVNIFPAESVVSEPITNSSGFLTKNQFEEALFYILTGGHEPVEAVKAASLIRLGIFTRELLALPKEFQELLLQLVNKTLDQPASDLLQLLQADPQILLSMPELQKSISTVSKSALEKLFRLLPASAPGDSNQMHVFLQLLNEIRTDIHTSPQQALERTLLLYLPWYPLPAPLQMSLELEGSLEEKTDQRGEAADKEELSSTVIVYLQTKHFGSIRLSLSQEGGTQLVIFVTHDRCFDVFLETFERNLKPALAKEGIYAVSLAYSGQLDSKPKPEGLAGESSPESTANPSQQLAISASGKVPAALILAAYLTTRIIFELDEQQAK